MSTPTPTVQVYTNDLELERTKQRQARKAPDRLAVIRNRIARAKAAKLVLIAAVAKENGDRTVEKDARNKLQDMGVLNPGQSLTDIYTVTESRRPSRSREARQRSAVLAYTA